MMPHASWRLAACMLAGLASTVAAQTHTNVLTPTSPTDSVAMAFDGASYVFTGIVRTVGGSTTHSVSPNHAIVVQVQSGVDTIFVSPGGMRPLTGREVTVAVDATSGYSVGMPLLLFARGLAADEGIAIRALAQMSTTGLKKDRVAAIIAAAQDDRRQKEVSSMYDRSAVVLTGKVDSVGPLAKSDSSDRRRRHDQEEYWRVAVVRLQRMYKDDARAPRPTVRVIFRQTMGDPRVLVAGQSYLLGLGSASAVPARVRDVEPKSYIVAEPGDIRALGDTLRLPRSRR